ADDGSVTAAGLAPPLSEPRSGESDFPASASESAPPLVDHASASAPPAGRSQPHPRSTARAGNAPTHSQTNACSRWLRSLPPPVPAIPRRKSVLPRYAAAGVPPIRPCPYPTLQFVGNSDESHTLYTSYTASFVSSASVISTSSLLETVWGPLSSYNQHPVKRARVFFSARVGMRNLLRRAEGSRDCRHGRFENTGCKQLRRILKCSGADPSGPFRELMRALAHLRTTRDDSFYGLLDFARIYSAKNLNAELIRDRHSPTAFQMHIHARHSAVRERLLQPSRERCDDPSDWPAGPVPKILPGCAPALLNLGRACSEIAASPGTEQTC